VDKGDMGGGKGGGGRGDPEISIVRGSSLPDYLYSEGSGQDL
jgi:hypothetical protein